MRKKVLGTILLPAILCWSASAQDARAILEEVARAMGATDLKAIRYSGSGYTFALGQSFTPEDPWPRFNLENYNRLVDYEGAASQEALIRTQGENPPRGGGSQPLIGIQRQVFLVSGEYAWNVVGTLPPPPEGRPDVLSLPFGSRSTVTAAPAAARERRLGIWLTPHGWVKAALAHNATVKSETIEGRTVTVVAFTLENGFQVNGTINEQNVVEKVETWIENPVLGDMPVEILYSNYQEFGGVPFPTSIVQKQGGFPTLEVRVSAVEPNPSDRIEVPEDARVTVTPPPRADTQEIAEGVWFIGGGSHNSVAVEFQDSVALIEAPQNEERSLAVIAAVKKLVPSKAIRYLINTHHHFDHSGGLRAYVAEGAMILTHQVNQRFYEQMFQSARKLRPDRLSQSFRRAWIEPVGEKYILKNGTRALELHHIQGNQHNGGLLMVYLPKEEILVEADAFSPAAPDAPPPATANPFSVNLYENVKRLKLGVFRIAPIHGRVVRWEELLKAIGKDNPPPPEGLLRATIQEPPAATKQ